MRVKEAFLGAALVAVAVSAAVVVASAQPPASSQTKAAAPDVTASACTFSVSDPRKVYLDVGRRIRTTGRVSGCGADTDWKLTLQRHRTGPWWQNEATRNWTGNTAGIHANGQCVSGTWTWRGIIESDKGKELSNNIRITC